MSAPTWDDVIEASVQGQAVGYAMGHGHGFQEGYEAAQRDAHERRAAAQIARAGVDGLDVLHARQKADAARRAA